jgi:hypothetical protein
MNLQGLKLAFVLGAVMVTAAAAQTAPASYRFAHGYNDGCFASGTGFNKLIEKIDDTTKGSNDFTCNTYTSGDSIQSQATVMQSNLKGETGKPLVIVGQSQGGIIGRYYTQFQRGDSDPKVYGLITVGTPHQGAPVLVNGPKLIGRIEGQLATATWGVTGWAQIIAGLSLNTGVSLTSIISKVGNIALGTNQGAQDLKPGSDVLKKLNTSSAQNCFWVASYSWRQVWWWWVQDTTWSYICQKNPDYKPIPSSTYFGSMWGSNNSIYSLDNRIATYMSYLGGIGAVTLPINIGLIIPTFGVAAVPASASAALLFESANFENNWKNEVVGDSQGDSFIPRYSQIAPSNIGGNYLQTVELPKLTHVNRQDSEVAESSSTVTIAGLNIMQARMKVQQTPPKKFCYQIPAGQPKNNCI